MPSIEQELINKISRLDAEKQRKVLEFVQSIISETPQSKTYSPSELMKMPPEERNRIVMASFELAADENFEIFEAYSEEDFDASS